MRTEPRHAAALAAAVVVAAAGAAGVVELARGDGFFGTRDWQVTGTAVVAFLCGLCATLGLRALGRRVLDPLGWLGLAAGVASFVPLAVGIWWLDGWREHGELLGRIDGTAAVALLAALVVVGEWLLLRTRSLAGRVLFAVVAVCAVVVVLLALVDIWSFDPFGGDTGTAGGNAGGRIAAVAAVVGVTAFLLTPLLQGVALPRVAREP